MIDLVKLRRFAQELADRWHEPALIITEDTYSEVHKTWHEAGYVVLLSMASTDERAAAHIRVEPKGGT